MIVYHTCSLKKLAKYLATGAILPPVRAWETPEDAARMAVSRGTRIILRLKFPNNAAKLEGHQNKARVLQVPYPFSKENY